MTDPINPRKASPREMLYDIRVAFDPRSVVNLPLLRSTLRVLRRRERERVGLPREPRPVETQAIEALLQQERCVLARGENEYVARMACAMLTRAHVKPEMCVQLPPSAEGSPAEDPPKANPPPPLTGGK